VKGHAWFRESSWEIGSVCSREGPIKVNIEQSNFDQNYTCAKIDIDFAEEMKKEYCEGENYKKMRRRAKSLSDLMDPFTSIN
jgi:hypothetical protein